MVARVVALMIKILETFTSPVRQHSCYSLQLVLRPDLYLLSLTLIVLMWRIG